MEKIFLDSNVGKVCCNYHHIENSKSIVIISHGFLSNKLSRTGVALAKELHKIGISTIALDMYGHGESEGTIEDLTVSKVVENTLAVYDFVAKKYTKIGLVGSSFSGSVSVIVASKRNVSVISLKCPVFDYQKLWFDRLDEEGVTQWKQEGFVTLFEKRVNYEAYEDAKKYHMKEIAKKVTAPTLIIHGDRDVTVPLEQPQLLLNSIASKEKQLHIVKGADHFFVSPLHFKEMIETSFTWLCRYLQ